MVLDIPIPVLVLVLVLVLTVADITLYSLLFRRFDLFHVPLVVAAMLALVALIPVAPPGCQKTEIGFTMSA